MTTKENILSLMDHSDYKPMGYKDMMYLLGIKNKNDKNELKKVLDKLLSEGNIIKNKKGKYIIPNGENYLVGILQGHAKGFGFVIPDNTIFSNDIFISPSDLKGAMDKDKVLVRLIRKSGSTKSAEGEIIKIIERGHKKIVGIYEDNKNFGFVIPDNDKICRDIYVPKAYANNAKTGDKVVVDITLWPEAKRNPEGKVVEILGNKNSIGIDILSIIREYDLPDDFPDEVKAELHNVPEIVKDDNLTQRTDLRNRKMVTIDGADAKDLDDAVSIKKLPNGNYELGVHIADVSYYVKEGTALDREAYERGTSVYLVDRVIPMLPRKLSNGICSLNANEDRLAFTCEMEIEKEGKVVQHNIFKSIINVNERMTYKDVTEILTTKNTQLEEKYSEFISDFELMEELAIILREKRRIKRGAIDFNFDEAKIILDEEGKPVEIKKYERNISNRIIEEFMLVCNETVAEHMFWTGLPFIYRVHEDPNSEKLQALSEFIINFGYKIHYRDKIHPKELQKLLTEMEGKKEENLLSRLILRAMQQAKYMEENLGHFGLSAKYYSHFTSPIRRYPDLMIHRIISYMLENSLSDKKISKLNKKIGEISQHCSERERVAEKAERDTDDLKKCEYMQSKIDETFDGIISSVTSFGFFVELDNTIEGLVRIQDITDDYYIYDGKNHRYVGEHTKKMYKLGDRIVIMVDKVNIPLRQIDFKVVDKTE
ncbi:MAG: ribonuclease R [Eubacteriaceae bacterium]